ncbi:hypothetical protein ACFOEQ_15130 [Chryseobacterium arachidis]|uniref:hypothetical protein n=1 Tax=Chryseobacterium arachidis TaxID=1416778 RepID=UPI00360C91FA
MKYYFINRFPGHEFDLSGRYSLQRGELGNKDFIFSLRYTFRMNVPTQKIADYTTLSGNIENLGVRKVEGIRLLLGSHLSITDKNGNYIFKNIIPGDYVLEIDRSSTDINDISTVNIPASLALTHKENIFNFGMTGAATVQGNIQFTEADNQVNFAQYPIKKDKKRNDNIIVEVSSDDLIFRKMAVIGESFDFTYLRPGDWKLKVYRNGLDKRFKIPIDTQQFTLKASEKKKITINVIKQKTEVKYQQENIKVSYNDARRR